MDAISWAVLNDIRRAYEIVILENGFGTYGGKNVKHFI